MIKPSKTKLGSSSSRRHLVAILAITALSVTSCLRRSDDLERGELSGASSINSPDPSYSTDHNTSSDETAWLIDPNSGMPPPEAQTGDEPKTGWESEPLEMMGGAELNKNCVSSSDCWSGYVCRSDGLCVMIECELDTDCWSDQVCVNYMCKSLMMPAPDEAEPSCADLDADGYSSNCYGSPYDCDDQDPLIFPGAPERLNMLDDDCDGRYDEDASSEGSGSDGYGGGY